ncbi:hypothetical protein [Arenimonas oryziterrae]|uniref:Lipoprotein n=1 Tax=Arenimonas oryziterrae DSM 21050 = YC6267 TaxID=1121015 RepID=A0A091AS86_9GAMM|nr:hypothetical protein [Arenimonas oryziterrae]KFN43038.1 hypothetical protein N789_10780 [Arenimonas oryziterrae DSM 21050 = YC6267]
MKAVSIALLACVIVTACASTGWPSKTDPSVISGTPDHFLVFDAASGALSEPAGPDCRNPMTDPRDGTRLTLIRSKAGFGDYQTTTPKYGLTGDQLLRIDCRDGRPVGATQGAS